MFGIKPLGDALCRGYLVLEHVPFGSDWLKAMVVKGFRQDYSADAGIRSIDWTERTMIVAMPYVRAQFEWLATCNMFDCFPVKGFHERKPQLRYGAMNKAVVYSNGKGPLAGLAFFDGVSTRRAEE